MNLLNYLIPSSPPEDKEVKIKAEIVKLDDNPYFRSEDYPQYLNKNVKHYSLDLTSKYRYKEDEPPDWLEGPTWGNSHPLKFYWSGLKKPTMSVFSKHIFFECRAALCSLEYPEHRRFLFKDRKYISVREVYQFTRLLGKDLFKTIDFVGDFYYWENRLYNSQKWVHYLSGELEWSGGNLAVGHNIYRFLNFIN
jgi:hypothetical protein